jgi:hypothetical protein
MRRVHPKWIEIHRANLATDDIQLHEGRPVTSAERPILDVLVTTRRSDLSRQAITDALRKGMLNPAQAIAARKHINLSASTTTIR